MAIATRIELVPAVDMAARAYTAAGCGPLTPAGARCGGQYGHGTHISCDETRCAATF